MSARSYIRELARLLCHGECKYIAMLHAYCDESYGGPLKTTPVYVVAGFVATAARWELFESLWRQTMKELRITHIGCHASDCANRAGPYRHLSREKCDDIQRRLIVDIVASELYGVVAVIDMDSYRAHQAELLSFFSKRARRFYEPHAQASRNAPFRCAMLLKK